MRTPAAAVLYGCLSLAAAPALPQSVPDQQGSQSAELQQLHQAAEQGDAEAQARLGSRYQVGEGVPQSHADAANWTRLAAEQGHARAQFRLGGMYYSGQGFPQDYAEADKWFRLAAEQGDADAQFALSVLYNMLALEGVLPQDPAEAAKWSRLAAEQGHTGAQYDLGRKYQHGHGVTQDHSEAVKWYRRAAEQGDAGAQYEIGVMYYNGEGVPQDYTTAHKWLNLAAARLRGEHRERVAATRDSVASKMTAEAIREAQRLAREWRPQAVPANANADQHQ